MCHISQLWQLWIKSNFFCNRWLWAGTKNLNFVIEHFIRSLALSDISEMNTLNSLSMFTFIIFTTDSTDFIIVATVKLWRLWRGWTTRIRIYYATGGHFILIWGLWAKEWIINVERVSFEGNVLYFRLSPSECPIIYCQLSLKHINIIVIVMFFCINLIQLLCLKPIVNLSKFVSNINAIKCFILFFIPKKWS
jgi:hypothetical protein